MDYNFVRVIVKPNKEYPLLTSEREQRGILYWNSTDSRAGQIGGTDPGDDSIFVLEDAELDKITNGQLLIILIALKIG